MCNMCSAFSPKFITQEIRDLVFDTQVIASTKHGDGFGYFVPSRNEPKLKSVYFKSDMPAYNSAYLTSEGNTAERSFLFSHTRKASSGKGTIPGKNDSEAWDAYLADQKDFAHPFVHKNVIVMHNGTLNPKAEFKSVCTMDSKFFAEKLSKAYDAKKKNYIEALQTAFGFFEDGIYSMMIAFMVDNEWKPFVLKGTKPLHIFKCLRCDTIIYVTDEDFFKGPALILEAKTSHDFSVEPSLTPGLYDPFTGECVHRGMFISEKVWKTTVYYTNRGKTQNTPVPTVVGQSGDNESPEVKLRNVYRKMGTFKFGLSLFKWLNMLDKPAMEKALSLSGEAFVNQLILAFAIVED